MNSSKKNSSMKHNGEARVTHFPELGHLTDLGPLYYTVLEEGPLR